MNPKTAAPAPLTLTPHPVIPLPALTHEHTLLHLLFHRNKNQHKSSKWWKHFSVLKRGVGKLTEEVRMVEEVTTSNTADKKKKQKKKKKKEKKETEEKWSPVVPSKVTSSSPAEKLAARIIYFKRVIIPGCYFAFTSLITSTQYAGLGMVLLGILSRIYKLTGAGELGSGSAEDFDGRVDEMADMQEALGRGFGEEDIGEVIDIGERVARVVGGDGAGEEDRLREVTGGGVVVEEGEGGDVFYGGGNEAIQEGRIQPTEDPTPEIPKCRPKSKKTKTREEPKSRNDTPSALPEKRKKPVEAVSATATSEKPPRKRKKKGGNAIDDLFAGLF